MFLRHCGMGLIGISLSLLGCAPIQDEELVADGDENVAEAEGEIITACSAFPQPATPIVYDRELVINSLSVVENLCRTTWDQGVNCGSTRGKWTFGWLMTAMSGSNNIDSPQAKQFVANWLTLFRSTQTPNAGSPAAVARQTIDQSLIEPWLASSNCPAGSTLATCQLNLRVAPFRLLAFVNRVDLDVGSAGGGGYAAGAEFRAVFGIVGFEPQMGTPNTPLSATVILEYGLPTFPNSGGLPWFMTAKDWASTLHQLSSFAPGTSQHLSQLQKITDAIFEPNAGINEDGPRANFSMINQVRTNEAAFDCNSGTKVGQTCSGTAPDPSLSKWEMRQFGFPGFCSGCSLVQESLPNTPDTNMNNTQPIHDFLINNQTSINDGTHVLPENMNGNVSQSPSFDASVVWENPNPINATTAPALTPLQRAQVRHHFGFGTCNGCHYRETQNQLETFHIAPREQGQVAGISQFLRPTPLNPDPLATSDGVNPTNALTVTEATNGLLKHKYSEPWRRACEIRRLLSGSTTPYTRRTGHTQL